MIGWMTVAFIIFAAMDLRPLIKQKKKREVAIYAVLFLTVYTLCALEVSGVELPNPLGGIEKFMKKIHLSY